MNSLLIKDHVFDWKALYDSGKYRNLEGWDKPYSYLDLAYEILRTHGKDIGRIDVVANLKRALDHRIKRISTNYNFKAMNSFGFPKEYVERMASLGLVKPLMIDVILKIRNLIEHHYYDPPDSKRCEELADFVWYFLKATDSYSRIFNKGITLNRDYDPGYGSIYGLVLNLESENDWKNVTVYGWLHPDDIEIKTDCGCEIILDKFNRKPETERPEFEELADNWDLLDENSVNISGRINLNKDNAFKLINAFFRADVHL